MSEEEIMIRAREAVIACENGWGPPDEIRAGLSDHTSVVRVAARALRDLSKPLAEIQQVDPDLMQARRMAADLLSGQYSDTPFIRGDKDASPEVRAILAAIRRGRELERGK